MSDNLDRMSKKEMREKLEKRKNANSTLILLALIAFYIFLWKTEVVALLVKLGAEIPVNG